MFQMLTSFNLKPDNQIEVFQRSLDNLMEHLQGINLVESRSPIGQRQTDTILDTDERPQQYFFLMYFKDKAQSDLAVEYIYAAKEPGDSIHKEVYANILDPIFICWEDLKDVTS